jgi:hypothetical protein
MAEGEMLAKDAFVGGGFEGRPLCGRARKRRMAGVIWI